MSSRERRSGPASLEDIFNAALARLDRPLRAWSLIVTVFGDVVAPRGGSLWLGTLNDIMGAFGIGEGVVRTAMSRLAADGWVTRDRIGRNSYYRLTPKATALSEAAAARIYRLPQRGWSGTWSLVVPKDAPGARLADRRAALHQAGFAQLSSGLFIAPADHDVPDEAARVFAFSARSSRAKTDDLEQDREIARSAWKLDEIAGGYRAFCDHYAPVASALAPSQGGSDLAALAFGCCWCTSFGASHCAIRACRSICWAATGRAWRHARSPGKSGSPASSRRSAGSTPMPAASTAPAGPLTGASPPLQDLARDPYCIAIRYRICCVYLFSVT